MSDDDKAGTYAATPESATPSLTWDEMRKLLEEIDRLRPPSMTEGEVMRLATYCYRMGLRDGEARGRAGQ